MLTRTLWRIGLRRPAVHAVVMAAVILSPAVAGAQPEPATPVQPEPTAQPVVTEPGVPDAGAAEQPGAGEVDTGAYSYDPENRRDPFVSPLIRGGGGRDLLGIVRPAGLPGLDINDTILRGIVLSQGTYIAILQDPSGATHIAREGDLLFDGRIQTITPDAVVFMQEVTDPLSPIRERQVRRPLRPEEVR